MPDQSAHASTFECVWLCSKSKYYENVSECVVLELLWRLLVLKGEKSTSYDHKTGSKYLFFFSSAHPALYM